MNPREAAKQQLGEWMAQRMDDAMFNGIMRAEDEDLLNGLLQPVRYEKITRRRRALARYTQLSIELVNARLQGEQDEYTAHLVRRYQDLYKFTQEEIDACIA